MKFGQMIAASKNDQFSLFMALLLPTVNLTANTRGKDIMHPLERIGTFLWCVLEFIS